jgi:hypothetical protein
MPARSLQQPWVRELATSHKDSKLVFSADNAGGTRQHLSTGLSQDHLVGGSCKTGPATPAPCLYH